VNPNGPNILTDLPPAIKNFPAYVASNYDPNSPAAQAILAAGYPPDIVNRSVTPSIRCGAGIPVILGSDRVPVAGAFRSDVSDVHGGTG
jgi:hypothetical protein